MRERRRRRYEEEEEAMQLDDVLEPYGQESYDYAQEVIYPQQDDMDPYEQGYEDGYYADEYSEEHEAIDHESRFRIALGMFDMVSIFVGIVVILLLVAMLFMLLDWLRSDILHSALLLQSGLK